MKPILRNEKGSVLNWNGNQMAYVTRYVLAWITGIAEPGWGSRDLAEAIMFPRLIRSDTKPSFQLLAMRNELWRIVDIIGPYYDKYYFKIARFENGGRIDESTCRVGFFDERAVDWNSCPSNRGVSLYVQRSGDGSKMIPSLLWDDLLVDGELELPEQNPASIDGVMDFLDGERPRLA
jgi:hypothetical protein